MYLKTVKSVKYLLLLFFLGGIFLLNQVAKQRAERPYSRALAPEVQVLPRSGGTMPQFAFQTAHGRRKSPAVFVGHWSLLLLSASASKPGWEFKKNLILQAQKEIKNFLLLPSPTFYALHVRAGEKSHVALPLSRSHSSRLHFGSVQTDQVKAMLEQLKLKNRLVHEGVFLVDPKGRLRAVFNEKLATAQQLVKDYIALTRG